MGLFDTLTNFFSDGRYSSLSQEQTEAFLDAITYAMVSDGEIADEEEDELGEALEEFNWNGSEPVELFVDHALDRAEQHLGDSASASDYWSDISGRLADQTLREETYYLSAKVACADQEILESERTFLNGMVEAFDISDRRLEMMTQELIKNEM